MILDMIGDRLKELREGGNLNQVQMGQVAGISKQHYGRIEKGIIEKPAPDLIERWARHFRVRMEWITTGKLPKEAAPPTAPAAANDDAWTDVTAYAQAAGMGTGPEAQEWAETHGLKFRRDSLSRKRLKADNLRVMYGAGDSMEPAIREGDAILFDLADTTLRNRAIYVLLVPGAGAEEYVVKRAIVSKGAASFISDNPDGDHNWKTPRPADGIKVVGRVRWTGGWVR